MIKALQGGQREKRKGKQEISGKKRGRRKRRDPFDNLETLTLYKCIRKINNQQNSCKIENKDSEKVMKVDSPEKESKVVDADRLGNKEEREISKQLLEQ